jgi:LemA protein
MASRAVNIIRALYGKEIRPRRRRGIIARLFRRNTGERQRKKKVLDLYRIRKKFLTRGRLAMFSVIGGLLLVFVISIYYYNKLTRYEQDVFKEGAKIESLLQRRRNISLNLAQTVRDYAEHERQVFKHVSDVRASSNGKQDAAAGKKNQALDEILKLLENDGAQGLSKLLAVAERYPDLKLSENFKRFMDALIETEKELSDERMVYSEVVNKYTTQTRTFPGNLFSSVYGFDELPYYQADQEARQFRPVEY